MLRRPLLIVTFIALLASIAAAGCGSAEPVVKKVDHVMISSYDAPALFAVFTETLGLPVAWPMTAYPGYETGGFQAGNINVEVLHYGSTGAATGGRGEMGFYGIVFDPYPLDEVTAVFEARGAKPSKPQVQASEVAGKKVPLWTNVMLDALCSRQYIVYLCEYTPATKARLSGRKTSGPHGGLGLESVAEMRITSKDPGPLKDKWQKIFAPSAFSTEGVMAVGDGPGIRIDQGKEDRIEGMLLEVSSLEKARAFLQTSGLLGEASGSELRLDPAKVQGLDIRVVEKKAT